MTTPEDGALMISASIIKQHIERECPEGTIEEKARVAFKECLTENCTWMLTNDDQRFRAGVGGLILLYGKDSDELARIKREMDTLKALSSAMQGVPVNWESVLNQAGGEDAEKPIGLLALYKEVKAES